MEAIGGAYGSVQAACGPAEPTEVCTYCVRIAYGCVNSKSWLSLAIGSSFTKPLCQPKLEFQAYQNCVMASVQGYVMENGLEGKATPEHAEEWEGCVAYARKYAQK